MTIARKTSCFVAVGFVAMAAVGCRHHDAPANDPGPMQKAGAAVDHAAGNAKDAVKDTGHDVKEDVKK